MASAHGSRNVEDEIAREEAWPLDSYEWNPITCVARKKRVVASGAPAGLIAKAVAINADLGFGGIGMSGVDTTGIAHQQLVFNPKLTSLPVLETADRNELETATHCEVVGCGVSLQGLKRYYVRMRVCEQHLHAPAIVLNGVISRFCQQCAKFQFVGEFSGSKKSCMATLERHNARHRAKVLARMQEQLDDNSDSKASGAKGKARTTGLKRQASKPAPAAAGRTSDPDHATAASVAAAVAAAAAAVTAAAPLAVPVPVGCLNSELTTADAGGSTEAAHIASGAMAQIYGNSLRPVDATVPTNSSSPYQPGAWDGASSGGAGAGFAGMPPRPLVTTGGNALVSMSNRDGSDSLPQTAPPAGTAVMSQQQQPFQQPRAKQHQPQKVHNMAPPPQQQQPWVASASPGAWGLCTPLQSQQQQTARSSGGTPFSSDLVSYDVRCALGALQQQLRPGPLAAPTPVPAMNMAASSGRTPPYRNAYGMAVSLIGGAFNAAGAPSRSGGDGSYSHCSTNSASNGPGGGSGSGSGSTVTTTHATARQAMMAGDGLGGAVGRPWPQTGCADASIVANNSATSCSVAEPCGSSGGVGAGVPTASPTCSMNEGVSGTRGHASAGILGAADAVHSGAGGGGPAAVSDVAARINTIMQELCPLIEQFKHDAMQPAAQQGASHASAFDAAAYDTAAASDAARAPSGPVNAGRDAEPRGRAPFQAPGDGGATVAALRDRMGSVSLPSSVEAAMAVMQEASQLAASLVVPAAGSAPWTVTSGAVTAASAAAAVGAPPLGQVQPQGPMPPGYNERTLVPAPTQSQPQLQSHQPQPNVQGTAMAGAQGWRPLAAHPVVLLNSGATATLSHQPNKPNFAFKSGPAGGSMVLRQPSAASLPPVVSTGTCQSVDAFPSGASVATVVCHQHQVVSRSGLSSNVFAAGAGAVVDDASPLGANALSGVHQQREQPEQPQQPPFQQPYSVQQESQPQELQQGLLAQGGFGNQGVAVKAGGGGGVNHPQSEGVVGPQLTAVPSVDGMDDELMQQLVAFLEEPGDAVQYDMQLQLQQQQMDVFSGIAVSTQATVTVQQETLQAQLYGARMSPFLWNTPNTTTTATAATTTPPPPPQLPPPQQQQQHHQQPAGFPQQPQQHHEHHHQQQHGHQHRQYGVSSAVGAMAGFGPSPAFVHGHGHGHSYGYGGAPQGWGLAPPAAAAAPPPQMLMAYASGESADLDDVDFRELTRVSLKAMNMLPHELPSNLQSKLRRWLKEARAEALQATLRPGCLQLVIDVRRPVGPAGAAAQAVPAGDLASQLIPAHDADQVAADVFHLMGSRLKDTYVQVDRKVLQIRVGVRPVVLEWQEAAEDGGLGGAKYPVIKGCDTAAVCAGGDATLALQGPHLDQRATKVFARLRGHELPARLLPAENAASNPTATSTTNTGASAGGGHLRMSVAVPPGTMGLLVVEVGVGHLLGDWWPMLVLPRGQEGAAAELRQLQESEREQAAAPATAAASSSTAGGQLQSEGPGAARGFKRLLFNLAAVLEVCADAMAAEAAAAAAAAASDGPVGEGPTTAAAAPAASSPRGRAPEQRCSSPDGSGDTHVTRSDASMMTLASAAGWSSGGAGDTVYSTDVGSSLGSMLTTSSTLPVRPCGAGSTVRLATPLVAGGRLVGAAAAALAAADRAAPTVVAPSDSSLRQALRRASRLLTYVVGRGLPHLTALLMSAADGLARSLECKTAQHRHPCDHPNDRQSPVAAAPAPANPASPSVPAPTPGPGQGLGQGQSQQGGCGSGGDRAALLMSYGVDPQALLPLAVLSGSTATVDALAAFAKSALGSPLRMDLPQGPHGMSTLHLAATLRDGGAMACHLIDTQPWAAWAWLCLAWAQPEVEAVPASQSQAGSAAAAVVPVASTAAATAATVAAGGGGGASTTLVDASGNGEDGTERSGRDGEDEGEEAAEDEEEEQEEEGPLATPPIRMTPGMLSVLLGCKRPLQSAVEALQAPPAAGAPGLASADADAGAGGAGGAAAVEALLCAVEAWGRTGQALLAALCEQLERQRL